MSRENALQQRPKHSHDTTRHKNAHTKNRVWGPISAPYNSRKQCRTIARKPEQKN